MKYVSDVQIPPTLNTRLDLRVRAFTDAEIQGSPRLSTPSLCTSALGVVGVNMRREIPWGWAHMPAVSEAFGHWACDLGC